MTKGKTVVAAIKAAALTGVLTFTNPLKSASYFKNSEAFELSSEAMLCLKAVETDESFSKNEKLFTLFSLARAKEVEFQNLLGSLVKDKTSLVEENKKLIKEKTGLAEENKNLKNKNMGLEKGNKKLAEENEGLANENKNLTDELDKQKKTFEEAIAALKKKLIETESKNRDTLIDDLHTKIADLKGEIKKKEEEKKGVEESVGRRDKTISDNKAQIDKLTEELNETTSLNAELDEELKELKDKLAATERSLQVAQEEAAENKKARDSFESSNSELRTKNSELQGTVETLHSEIFNLLLSYEKFLNELAELGSLKSEKDIEQKMNAITNSAAKSLNKTMNGAKKGNTKYRDPEESDDSLVLDPAGDVLKAIGNALTEKVRKIKKLDKEVEKLTPKQKAYDDLNQWLVRVAQAISGEVISSDSVAKSTVENFITKLNKTGEEKGVEVLGVNDLADQMRAFYKELFAGIKSSILPEGEEFDTKETYLSLMGENRDLWQEIFIRALHLRKSRRKMLGKTTFSARKQSSVSVSSLEEDLSSSDGAHPTTYFSLVVNFLDYMSLLVKGDLNTACVRYMNNMNVERATKWLIKRQQDLQEIQNLREVAEMDLSEL